MDRKKVVVERTYNAPIDTVWEALTNKDQMKQWYFEVSDFKAEVGFEFEFYGESKGKKYLHKCTVVEANPKTKIAYTWRYEGYEGQSLVTFELFSEDKNKTRVKVTHSDLDTFSSDNPDFAQNNFNEGWNIIMGKSLYNFVEQESFSKSIRIHAGADQIWNIILNPNNQWGLAFGGGATAETDWNEGSAIIWRDLSGHIGASGIVEVHEANKYLQLHYYDDVQPAPGSTLGEYYEKYTVVPEDGESVLSIEVGKIAKRYVAHHQEMWEDALKIIKDLAEKH